MDMNTFLRMEEESTCTGKIYRCKINHFLNSKNEYVEQVRMVPQKRLSCKGCPHCVYLEESISDFIQEQETLIPEETVNDALYRLEIIDEVRDWETGVIDEWNLAFIRMGTDE